MNNGLHVRNVIGGDTSVTPALSIWRAPSIAVATTRNDCWADEACRCVESATAPERRASRTVLQMPQLCERVM